MRFLRKIFDYASTGNYTAPGKSWDATPRLILPTDGELSAGATPDTPISAQLENGRFKIVSDALAVQAHAALQQWDVASIPQIGTDAYLSPVGLRIARGYANVADTQREVLVVGYDTAASNHMRVAHMADGTVSETIPSTTATFAPAFWAIPGAAGELGVINNGVQFAWTTTSGTTWNLSAGYSGPPNVLALHYDSALGYFAFTTSTPNAFHGTSFANLSSGATSATIATPASSSFAADEVEVASNGTVIVVAATTQAGVSQIYRSTDSGATWATSLTPAAGAHHINVTWSEYYGLFIAWNDLGDFFVSADAAPGGWVNTAGGKTPAVGFLAGRGTLVACGPAIAKLTYYTGAYGTISGIAYSFDLGFTWNYHYFNAGFLVALRSINGRIYALSGFNSRLFRSGILGAPGAES